MTLQPVLDASVLLSVFRRNGGEGQLTMEFDNLPPEKREMIQKAGPLQPDEVAVLASTSEDIHWFVITNMRLIVCQNYPLIDLPLSSISEVVPKLAPTKQQYRTLIVHTFEKVDYVFNIEPGTPFSGIWNVLKRVAVVNNHK